MDDEKLSLLQNILKALGLPHGQKTCWRYRQDPDFPKPDLERGTTKYYVPRKILVYLKIKK